MKKTFFLFLFQCLFSTLSWSQTELETKIDFFIEGATIIEALDQLSEAIHLDIAYSSRFFSPTQTIALQLKDHQITAVLDAILASTKVKYRVIENQIVLFQKQEISKREFTISGYIEAADSDERLIAASVHCETTKRWILSNEYGYYSLRLPEGPTKIQVNYLGCDPLEKVFDLTEDLEMDFALSSSFTLTEVIVTPTDSTDQALDQLDEAGRTVAQHFVTIGPSLVGENDILRTIQFLPGVQSAADGFGGIYVRGGSGGQNLMLLDGAPIYNPLHLLGVFSIYNTTAIRSARLIRGAFPARYGGRLSSVFDVYTKEGNRQAWKAEAELGFLSAKASVEGPLFKEKGALFLAGRRSHFGLLLKPSLNKALSQYNEEDLDFNFYDFNAKLNYTFSKKNRVFLSFYKGGDFFIRNENNITEGIEIDLEDLLRWGNTLATFRWNHLYGARLFSNTTATYSLYDYRSAALASFFTSEIADLGNYIYTDYRSQIEDVSIKTDFDFLASPRHHFRFGAGLTLHNYAPFNGTTNEVVSFVEQDSLTIESVTDSDLSIDQFYNFEGHLYFEDDFKLNSKWTFNLGLRLSAFSFIPEDTDFNLGGGMIVELEPRLRVNYQFTPRMQLHSSFGKMVQNTHLISVGELRSPADVWLPSGEFVGPEISRLGELGWIYTSPSDLRFSFDTYYKRIDQILTLIGRIDNGIPVVGTAEAYGFEWMVEKQKGNTGGWVNYTLAWANRTFEEINGGQAYPYEYDSRHQFKFFGYHQLNPHWTFSLNWTYQSARPQNLIEDDLSSFVTGEFNDPFVGNKNVRSTANHRLDLSLSYRLKAKRFDHDFKLSIYNVYNRKNIAFYRVSYSFDESIEVTEVHLLPIMPSLQYRISF